MGSITLKQVAKRFDEVEVIPPLDLSIEDGEFVVFVGPSGCGKSTLLRLIAGLEDVSGGQINIDGRDATELPPAKRGLAMVFQSYALYPHMSVRKNIAFPLKMAGLDKAAIDEKVDYAARTLNLTDYINRRPGQLSGGQRQRVAIGRAIVREPSAFLFDEPLSNLDAALRGNMRLEIAELPQKLATTMVYVTHDQVEAMTLADRIVVLRAGRVEQVGTPLELYREPANRFVAGFIGSPAMNFLDARAEGGRVLLGGAAVTSTALPDGPCTLGLRPEHLARDPDGALDASVQVFEHLGGEAFVYATLPDGQEIVAKLDGDEGFRPGDALRLGVAGHRCHVFDRRGVRAAPGVPGP